VTATREDLTRVLTTASFQSGYGFRVRACGDGECTLEVPFRPVFVLVAGYSPPSRAIRLSGGRREFRLRLS